MGYKMIAKIKNIEQRKIPNILEPMTVVTVDFVDDAGSVVHTQEYGQMSENVDMESFQRQADAMQNDLNMTKQLAIAKPVPETGGKHYRITVNDSAKIKEGR